MNKIVIINQDKCIACKVCVEICPNKILYIKDDVCKVTNEKNVINQGDVKKFAQLVQ